MISYILRRLVVAVFMMMGIALVSFIVIKLPPGDYASRYEGYLLGRGATQEDADRAGEFIRKEYDLDKPVAT